MGWCQARVINLHFHRQLSNGPGREQLSSSNYVLKMVTLDNLLDLSYISTFRLLYYGHVKFQSVHALTHSSSKLYQATYQVILSFFLYQQRHHTHTKPLLNIEIKSEFSSLIT